MQIDLVISPSPMDQKKVDFFFCWCSIVKFSQISHRMSSEIGEGRVILVDTESNSIESHNKTPTRRLDEVGLTDPSTQKDLNEDKIVPPSREIFEPIEEANNAWTLDASLADNANKSFRILD